MTRVRISAFSTVVVFLASLVGWVAATGLEQDLRAARDEGRPGIFAPTEAVCVQHPGHESCTCHGTFVPGDGGVRAPETDDTRITPAEETHETALHSAGSDTCLPGREIEAVDTGASGRVYGPDGSREWLLSGFLLAASVLTVTVAVARAFRPAESDTQPDTGPDRVSR